MVRGLRAAGVTEVCFAGAMGRPPLDPTALDDLTKALMPRLMAQASEAERTCLTLAYAAGMSHPEISEVTGFPLGTVKSHITRGKRKLQEWLHEHDHPVSPTTGTGRNAQEARDA